MNDPVHSEAPDQIISRSLNPLSNSIKVEFQGEMKKIHRVHEFRKFFNLAVQRFDGLSSDDTLKFTYVDQDKDVISISCDSDLEEALDQASGMSLVVTIKKVESSLQTVSYVSQSKPTFRKPEESKLE